MGPPILSCIMCVRSADSGSVAAVSLMNDLGLLGMVHFINLMPGESRWSGHVRAARAMVEIRDEDPGVQDHPALLLDADAIPTSRDPLTTRRLIREAALRMTRGHAWHVVMLGWAALYDMRPRDLVFGSLLGACRLMSSDGLDDGDGGPDDDENNVFNKAHKLVGPAGGFDPCAYLLSYAAASAMASEDEDDTSLTLARWLRAGDDGRWRDGTVCTVPPLFTVRSRGRLLTDVLVLTRVWRTPLFLAAMALLVAGAVCVVVMFL